MRSSIIVIAVTLAATAAVHAAERLPQLDIRKSCQAAQKAQDGITDPVAKCMKDETAAKNQLQAVWAKAKPQARSTCSGLNAESPYKSYADILTCMQMYQ
jgi:hypothetical protein